MSENFTGQCHCGAVRFTVAASPIGVIACHCRDCQQMHGNYNAMARVARAALTVEGDGLTWYASSETARRGFCTICGGRLFKDNLGTDAIMVSMGAFDRSTGLRILKNIWTESKADWYDLPQEEPSGFES